MIPRGTFRKLWKGVAAIAILTVSASAGAATQSGAVHWEAQWIWPSPAAIATHKNQFMLFRKTFTLAHSASKADLAIFADSRYRLYVNGAYIGQGPARAPARYYYYDVFDVASHLRPGLNVIAVEVRWFGQGMAWYEPPPVSAQFGSRTHGALLCQLDLGEGAGRQIVKTDASWKATEDHAWDWNTPVINFSLANIEVYHSDRVVKGWTEPQFDDSGWIPVEVIKGIWGLTSPPEGPYIHLVPRPLAYPLEKEITPEKLVSAGVFSGRAQQASFFRGGSPLATLGKSIANEKHEPQPSILHSAAALTNSSSDYAEIQPGADGKTPYVILDMGREVDGYLQFSVESTKPASLDIGWSEMMENGSITADQPGGNYVAQYDVAPGSQHWTMWGWHAMRFVELSFPHLAAPMKFRVNMRFSTAKLNHAGSFSSSSPLLTKLWQMGAYTWQLCTLDGTMDCPTREQHQWLGDG
ncbi:MAG: alpha-L-rhamnosidase N-terminal domain-containing protein, partial [Terriglobia bacterium]